MMMIVGWWHSDEKNSAYHRHISRKRNSSESSSHTCYKMKLSAAATAYCLAATTSSTVTAFTAVLPRSATLTSSSSSSSSYALLWNTRSSLLTAAAGEDDYFSSSTVAPPNETMDQEVERLVQEAKDKAARMSKMSSKDGKEYAPWMNMSDEDLKLVRATAREKAAARRKRQEEERNVSGSLQRDSAFQELSGTGLKGKVTNNGKAVELEWATGSEKNTRGFIVKRRMAKTSNYSVLSSYETFGPLASKGVDGGVYRFLDETVEPGGYFYRITECDTDGVENDLSQCLVEIATESEQKSQVLALVALGVLAAGVFGAGLFLDPLQ